MKGAGKVATSGRGLLGAAVGLSGGLLGGTLAMGVSMVAKQQEKANAREALALLDKALALIDYAGPRFAKAQIYASLGQKEDAIRELDVIIKKFPDDDVYISARKMKDELSTKKKGWFS